MGKVKDGVPASKPSKPAKGGPAGGSRRRFAQFLVNLVRADLYKPMQGWYARLYTALGLGVVVALGLWRLYETLIDLVARDPVRHPGGRRAGPRLAHLPARPVSRRSSSS